MEIAIGQCYYASGQVASEKELIRLMSCSLIKWVDGHVDTLLPTLTGSCILDWMFGVVMYQGAPSFASVNYVARFKGSSYGNAKV